MIYTGESQSQSSVISPHLSGVEGPIDAIFCGKKLASGFWHIQARPESGTERLAVASGFVGIRHAVSDSRLGDDVGVIGAIVAEFDTKPPQVSAQRLQVARLLRAPYPSQKLLVGHDTPVADRKLDEQPVLDRRQIQPATVHCNEPFGIVDSQFPQTVRFGAERIVRVPCACAE